MPPRPPRVAAIGECMIELRHRNDWRLDLAFGGDTFNTAAYLARLGREEGLSVDYATALGEDPYSAAMRAAFAREGIGLSLVRTIAGRLPGLYAIRTDAQGERTFFYWRREAAARAMFDGPEGEALARALQDYDWLYFSGITLSILDDEARLMLFAALDAARARGAHIAFDPNYRPLGWSEPAVARAVMSEALRRSDLALPTFLDERSLFGDADAEACVRRLTKLGVKEIAIKDSGAPALVHDGTHHANVPANSVARIVDTTAAGDAFNAGYLHARITGRPALEAASAGHRLAASVVAHPGAIIPAASMPRPA
jgi:2-dehydro-3-deoxygluconokinase